MRIETYLNAMIAAYGMRFGVQGDKRNRQYFNFRMGLIVRDVRKERKIEYQQIEINALNELLGKVDEQP